MKPNVVLSERRWLLTSDFPETHFQSTNPALAQYESSTTRSSTAPTAFSTGQEGQETAFHLEFLPEKLLMCISTSLPLLSHSQAYDSCFL